MSRGWRRVAGELAVLAFLVAAALGLLAVLQLVVHGHVSW